MKLINSVLFIQVNQRLIRYDLIKTLHFVYCQLTNENQFLNFRICFIRYKTLNHMSVFICYFNHLNGIGFIYFIVLHLLQAVILIKNNS